MHLMLMKLAARPGKEPKNIIANVVVKQLCIVSSVGRGKLVTELSIINADEVALLSLLVLPGDKYKE